MTVINACWSFLACSRDDQIKKEELNSNSVLKYPVQSLVIFYLDVVINYYLEFIGLSFFIKASNYH